MRDILKGYSKALYASWYYYRPARLLLDAGEGIIHGLGKRVFGIRQVFLSHGHEDHIAGLPSLVNLRNLSNGDREIPLAVHYPEGDPFVGYLREYLDKKQKHRLQYRMEWRPLTPGDTVRVEVARRDTRVAAFAVDHTRHWQSLGYRIEERRQVLRDDFADAAPDEVKALIREHGRERVLREAWHPLLAYTGDTRPLREIDPVRGADILMIEATNIDGTEKAGLNHSHIDDAFRVAAEAGVRHLVLVHLSGRYSKQEILQGIAAAVARHGRPPYFGYFFERRYFDLSEGG